MFGDEVMKTSRQTLSAIVLVAAASTTAAVRAQQAQSPSGPPEKPQPGYAQVQPTPAPQPPIGPQERRIEQRIDRGPTEGVRDNARQRPSAREMQPPFATDKMERPSR
jgi:hypothetical protein